MTIVAVGIYVLWASWLRWPDVLVDFGRELYVPWRLSAGEILYEDLAYFNGPFSPWLNSLAFRAGRPAIWNLFTLNFLVLTGIVAALWSLTSRMGGRLAALTSVALFLSIHAASQFTRAGNYNYLAPYSHEATHGLALCLVAFLLVWGYLNRRSRIPLLLIGAVLGLLFLGKPEFVVAGSIAVAVAIAAHAWTTRGRLSDTLSSLGLVGVSALTVVAAAWCRLWLASGSAVANRGTLGAWPHIVGTRVTGLDFYTKGMGLDDLSGNLSSLVLVAAVGALILVPAALLAMRLPPRKDLASRLAAVAGALLLALAAIAPMRARLFDLAKPLPLILLAALPVLAVRLRQDRANMQYDPRRILAFSFVVFAIALLLKMFFNTRVYHYGFVLTVPAVILLATLLTAWIPELIGRRGGWAYLFQAVALGLLVTLGFVHLSQSKENLQEIKYSVGEGRNRFLADGRGPLVVELQRKLDQLLEPGQTLAVLPEGVMINFLSQRLNPTPFFSFMPPEVLMFGEANMLQAVQDNPPDWVVFFNRSASEYGYTLLGQDYGADLMTWIESQYELRDALSDPGRRGRQFSTALIYRYRKDGREDGL